MATCMKFNFSDPFIASNGRRRYANEFNSAPFHCQDISVKAHSLPPRLQWCWLRIVRNIFCFRTWLPIINFHITAIKKQTQKPATSFQLFFLGIKFLDAKPRETNPFAGGDGERRRKENPLSTSLPFCVTASRMFFRYFFISLFVKRSEWKQWCGFWCHLLLVI